MILRRNFRPSRVLPYVYREVLFTFVVATLVLLLVERPGLALLALPFAPLGVLGTALAILLGFRNNTAYARWWEARTAWAGLASNSRNLARQIAASADNAIHLGKGGGPEKVRAFEREVVLRQIAFAHALRLHLRGQGDLEALEPLLPPEDLVRLRAAHNRPNVLLQIQGLRLKDGVRQEMVGQFDPIVLEPNLAACHTWQVTCERIKTTPLLRPYDFFTRVFVWLFLSLLPSSLLGLFPAGGPRWLILPLSLLIGFTYAITHKVGLVNENPFENKPQDVPMTSVCTEIERDLKEQLGDTDLPASLEPQDGYLY